MAIFLLPGSGQFFCPISVQIPSSSHFMHQIALLALIHSGAQANFLDHEVAVQSVIILEPLQTPCTAMALNGMFLAHIKHHTVPATLMHSGNHRESIRFNVIGAPKTPLVLGYPWLEKHNPHINWSAGRICGWSSFCHSVCLQAALFPAEGTIKPFKPDLEPGSSIPAEYHDLGEVFSKDRPLSLLPHRPHDCAIGLLPGAPLPSSHLYNLSRMEREAMEKYTKDSLAASMIRSSSPLEEGFFFVA